MDVQSEETLLGLLEGLLDSLFVLVHITDEELPTSTCSSSSGKFLLKTFT